MRTVRSVAATTAIGLYFPAMAGTRAQATPTIRVPVL
jgi:hypothetical protein